MLKEEYLITVNKILSSLDQSDIPKEDHPSILTETLICKARKDGIDFSILCYLLSELWILSEIEEADEED